MKTAETFAADKTTDNAIYFARIIREIYTGEKSHDRILVEMYTNSKPLFESIYSTKQVDRKTMRHMIQGMKDSLARGEVNSFHWIDTKKMLANIFTTDSANCDLVKRVIKEGNLKQAINIKEA